MEMIVKFPEGLRVDAHFGPFEICTDQMPVAGGQGSAPNPFMLFLASLGTCAGFYALGFCRQRGIDTTGMQIVQRMHRDENTGLIEKVEMEIQLPEGFPEKYRTAIINAANLCTVKKHLENPPLIEVTTAAGVGVEN